MLTDVVVVVLLTLVDKMHIFGCRQRRDVFGDHVLQLGPVDQMCTVEIVLDPKLTLEAL